MRLRIRQMQWRIAGASIGLILLLVTILSSVFLLMLRARYLEALELGLAGQARMIAALTPASGPLDDGALVWQRQVHGHVTLVGADGTVLVDMPPLLAVGTDMRNRPEIQDALQFGRGEATRSSSSAATGQEMFYVAVPAPDSATVAVVRVGVPLTTVAEAEGQILKTVVATASLAMLGAVAIALVLARQITRPLHDLRTMATRLANGELDVAVPLPADEDLAALAADFNRMAQVLRHLITSREAERQRLATTVMTMADGLLMISADDQVTSLNPAAERWLADPPPAIPFSLAAMPMGAALAQAVRRARTTPPDQMPLVLDEVPLERDVRAVRAVITCLPAPESDQALIVLQDMTTLRQAERSRRTLLANLSHDFRTPLASLRAIVDTLQDGALDDRAAAIDFLGRMDAEVESLSHLVTEFLELSQLESGQITLQPEPIDLDHHLRAILERMTPQALHHGVTLTRDLPATLPILWLDPRRFEQVMFNLLQNALSFTPAGGQITIGVRLTDAMVSIAVQDTGAGIAAADVPHIFERFFRADRARSRVGAGLGLAIVRHLIELQGGTVTATSQLGVGTTISIFLPRTPPVNPRSPAV